ncbi:MAG: hypothetical protein ACR2NN_07395 [Bryobacteraceae bacterium]
MANQRLEVVTILDAAVYRRKAGNNIEKLGMTGIASPRARPDGETLGCKEWIDHVVIGPDRDISSDVGGRIIGSAPSSLS